MRWWEARFVVPQEASEAIAAVLHEWSEVNGVSIEGLQEDVPSHAEYGEWFDESLLQTSDLTITVYVPEDIAEVDLHNRILHAIDTVEAAGLAVGEARDTITLDLVDETSWEEAWKKHFQPIPIGERFIIVPKWEESVVEPGNRTSIVLEPGMAFGTGAHATTQLCLEALESVGVEGKRVLDIGCGTAVIAIAAAKAGAAAVSAVDIDPVAVRVATANVEDNEVADCVQVYQGDLLNGFDQSVYDVIFANILRDAVIALTPQAAIRLGVGGRYIVSGFVTSQQAMVESALWKEGFVVDRVFTREDWVALVAVKAA